MRLLDLKLAILEAVHYTISQICLETAHPLHGSLTVQKLQAVKNCCSMPEG